jgi:hypothetical protein
MGGREKVKYQSEEFGLSSVDREVLLANYQIES